MRDKLDIAKKALRTIANWDDDTDEFDCPGQCAIQALLEIEKKQKGNLLRDEVAKMISSYLLEGRVLPINLVMQYNIFCATLNENDNE